MSALAFAITAVACLGLVGCGGDLGSTGDGHTTTTQGETTTDESTSGDLTETDTADSNDDDWSSSGSFYGVPDTEYPTSWGCDSWFQDCPDGEKCVPYASTGTTWDANKCVPILGNGAPGDPCSSNGLVAATDTCDGTGICWHVDVDDGQSGVCTPFCTQTPDDPQCAETQTCVIANEGAINLCLDACEPLTDDCDEGYGCFFANGTFACMLALDEPLGQPCGFFNDCPADSMCVVGSLVPECDASNCCAQYCSLAEPSCEQAETECVPVYEADPPAGLEDLGLCLGPV